MSPELERLLRRGREALPEPDGDATRRARARALRAIRARPRRRGRARLLVGTVLVLAAGLGIGLGTALAPSGEASKGPIGLGFLPEPGWHSLQAPTRAPSGSPQVAIVANVPFAPDDSVNGLADPSALPYTTLLSLPPRGIVIVSSFVSSVSRSSTFPRYPETRLPLELAEATPYIEFGTQLRPEQPLGQYQLRAAVEGWDVEVQVYFGSVRPGPGLLAQAQRQLDRLVVRSKAPENSSAPATTSTPRAPLQTLDRTFVCSPALIGGIRQIDTRAYRGSGKHGSGWDRPAFADVSTSVSGAAATAIEDELAWITAGPPSPEATVVSTRVGFTFPMRAWGTVAVNRRLCRPAPVRVALQPDGLQGGAVGTLDERWDCASGSRVLVRIRASLAGVARLSTYRGFLRTTAPVESAALAVSTSSGKPLLTARVLRSGKALLHTSPSCAPD